MVDGAGPVVTPSVNVPPAVQTDSSQGSSGMELLAIKASFSPGGELSGLLTTEELNALSTELDSLSEVLQSSPNPDVVLSSALSQIYTEVENLTVSSPKSDVTTVLTQTQALSNFETAFTAFTSNPTPTSFEDLLEAVSNFPTGMSQTASNQQIATAFAALSADLQTSMMQDITKKYQLDITTGVKKYGGFLLSGFGNSLVTDTGNNMLDFLLTKNNVTLSSATTIASLKQTIQQYSGLPLTDEQVESYVGYLFDKNLAAYRDNPSVGTFLDAYYAFMNLPADVQKSSGSQLYSAVSGSKQSTRDRGAEMSLVAFQDIPSYTSFQGLAYVVGTLFQEPDDILLSQAVYGAFYNLPLDQQQAYLNSIVTDTTKTPIQKLQLFSNFLGGGEANEYLNDTYFAIIYSACPSFSIDLSNIDPNSTDSMTQLGTALNKMLSEMNAPPFSNIQVNDFATYVLNQAYNQAYNQAVTNFDSNPSLQTFEDLVTATTHLPIAQQLSLYTDIADKLSTLGQEKPATAFKAIMDGLNAQKATSTLPDTTKAAIKTIIQFAKVNKAESTFAATPNQENLSDALNAISKLPSASQADKYTDLENQFSSLPAATQTALVSGIATYFTNSATTDANKALYYPITSYINQSYMMANFNSNPSVQTLFDASDWVAMLDPTQQDGAYQALATSFLTLPTTIQSSITGSIQAGLLDGSITQADIQGFEDALFAMTPSNTTLANLLSSLTVDETQIFNEFQKEMDAGTFTIQGSNFSATDQLNKIAESLGYATPLTTAQISDLMPYVTDATQKKLASFAASIQNQNQQSSELASLAGVSILYAIAGAMVGLLKNEQNKLDQDNALFVVAQDKVTAMNNVSNYYLTDIQAGKSISPEKFQLSIIVAYNPDALDGINANLENLSPPEGIGDIINKIQDGTPLSAAESTIMDQGYKAVLASNSSIASDWAGAVDVTTVQASKPDLKFDTSTWTFDTGTTPPTLTSPTTLATTFSKISQDITTNITSVSNIITQQLQAQISEDTQELNTVITTANTLIQQYGQSLLTDAQNIK